MDARTGNAVLAHLREITQETLVVMSGRIGVTPPTICMAETGARRLSARLALRIWSVYRDDLARLGYSLEDLLRGSRTREPQPEDRA